MRQDFDDFDNGVRAGFAWLGNQLRGVRGESVIGPAGVLLGALSDIPRPGGVHIESPCKSVRSGAQIGERDLQPVARRLRHLERGARQSRIGRALFSSDVQPYALTSTVDTTWLPGGITTASGDVPVATRSPSTSQVKLPDSGSSPVKVSGWLHASAVQVMSPNAKSGEYGGETAMSWLRLSAQPPRS